MNPELLLSSLTNPTLLFFGLGIFAALVKSDLEIPAPTVKFISLYLLFSIGFKGGQELSHGTFNSEILGSLVLGFLLASVIPVIVFFILRRKLGVINAGAVAATYGSVSAVTFVAAAAFLESRGMKFGGHMVAVMALMEAPAIVVGVVLMKRFSASAEESARPLLPILSHSLTNGSVILIFGSLVIGLVSDAKQAEGIRPFTTDIFKGFLAIFLLEMGMVTARRIGGCLKYGPIILAFGLLAPLFFGSITAILSGIVTADPANRFTFAVLAASASYIAVPAAMKLAAPDADPGLYVPMALGLTFPFNITLGMPVYMALASLNVFV